jgi:hypothetical protein
MTYPFEYLERGREFSGGDFHKFKIYVDAPNRANTRFRARISYHPRRGAPTKVRFVYIPGRLTVTIGRGGDWAGEYEDTREFVVRVSQPGLEDFFFRVVRRLARRLTRDLLRALPVGVATKIDLVTRQAIDDVRGVDA